jgi:hypothetical protein
VIIVLQMPALVMSSRSEEPVIPTSWTEERSHKRRLLRSPSQPSIAPKRSRKWFSFPLENPEVVKKLQAIIVLINDCIFSIPFLVKRHEGDTGRPHSIDEIKERLRGGLYKQTGEVFEDLEYVFCLRENEDGEERELTVSDEVRVRRVTVRHRELDMMAREMRSNLTVWIEETFAD